jgi:hypothetical protein
MLKKNNFVFIIIGFKKYLNFQEECCVYDADAWVFTQKVHK